MLSSLFFHTEHALKGESACHYLISISTHKTGSLCGDLIYFSFDQKREGNVAY